MGKCLTAPRDLELEAWCKFPTIHSGNAHPRFGKRLQSKILKLNLTSGFEGAASPMACAHVLLTFFFPGEKAGVEAAGEQQIGKVSDGGGQTAWIVCEDRGVPSPRRHRVKGPFSGLADQLRQMARRVPRDMATCRKISSVHPENRPSQARQTHAAIQNSKVEFNFRFCGSCVTARACDWRSLSADWQIR